VKKSSRKIMFTRPLSLDLPTTIDEAVAILLEDLRLLDRTLMGSMTPHELDAVNRVVGLQITRDFRLWSGNEMLLHQCLAALEETGTEDEDPTMAIIRAMWEKLQETHVLRLVK
jgi:hypothetical protein